MNQPTAQLPRRLTKNVQTLLLDALRTAGTYDPKAVLPLIEHQLRQAEARAISAFLKWVHDNKGGFGRDTLEAAYGEFRSARSRPSHPPSV